MPPENDTDEPAAPRATAYHISQYPVRGDYLQRVSATPVRTGRRSFVEFDLSTRTAGP